MENKPGTIKEKIPVAILGGTGAVGQRFIQLLADHPWFEVAAITGSQRTVGGDYGEVCRWVLDEDPPAGIRDLVVQDSKPGLPANIVFSALPSGIASEVEPAFARAGLISYTTEALLSLPVPPLVVILLIYGIFLILGTMIEGIPLLLMTVPVVFPTVLALGYDPVWFGLIVVLLCVTGNFTPPVGVTLFVLQALRPDRPLTEIYKGVMPFAAIVATLVAIVTAFPELATYLPGVLIGD